MLSSDVLETQFGHTYVDVLYQDNTNRIISTLTALGEKTLELSWVTFDAEGVETFSKTHSLVAKGVSMGKAFRETGIPFARVTRTLGQLALPVSHARRFGSNRPATVTEVNIFAGDEQTFYCSILETYSPDVDWPEDASEYPDPSLARLRDFSDFLDAAAK